MALNVWAGWAPVILANNGFKPGKVWKTADGKTFKLELVLIDDPIAMRDAYASGKVHIGWATLDMIPLFVEQLKKGLAHDAARLPADRLVERRRRHRLPREHQVRRRHARQDGRARAELAVALLPAQHAHRGRPSAERGEYKFTQDAFQAAAAFNADKSVACVVSWAPDIYNLADAKGNKMLVNTQTANKLIADVWFARADFAKDNPQIIEGLARGIFEAMETLKARKGRRRPRS